MTNEFLEVPDSSGLANAIDRGNAEELMPRFRP
jgi:hypothetical protein